MQRFTLQNIPKIGLELGSLKVISSPFYKNKYKFRRHFITCECKCGKIKDILMTSLYQARSCGCKWRSAIRRHRNGSDLDENGNKTCGCCKLIKQEKDFAKTSSYKDGLARECRECNKYRKIASSYGLSQKEYIELLQKVSYSCECCGIKFDNSIGKTKCHIDHDHQTGKIRGLLCNNCNLGIGSLGDTITSIENALKYLKKHYENNKH